MEYTSLYMTEVKKSGFDPTIPICVLGISTTLGRVIEAVENLGPLPQSKIRDLLEGTRPKTSDPEDYAGSYVGTRYPAPEEEKGF